MARIDFEGPVAAVYESGRGAPDGGLDGWRTALAAHLPVAAPVLDLGAGTGLYARLLHTWFGVRVVAVEPAFAMLRQAAPPAHRAVGRAERIPLASGCCGAAWLSTMIHHVGDLPAAARELRRVLLPEAPVLIRSAFPGDQERIALYRFFPTAGAVLDTFPTVAQVRAAFETAGYALREQRRVRQINAATLEDYYEKVRHRANTTLHAIPDAEFAAGLRALRAAADSGVREPAVSELTLLVLSPR
ncbi:ubiquinone/menaquinone biosynthesis methyltransferase ubiE [Actinoplanes sp. SE50]|uniref:class I SAM-dependent methyltransferase n=1 Tax=unclassified Actinoplanes TaxID=2626549 RepID=UPI00023ED1E9|nr:MULTISPECIES: class I SAM-dependent methyltransferase [unclassified Actinoplanes]AEV83309.1 Ubiquinone/menaquinone biosynthesis methyltransferase ubiE [Actinoplanes sp. SE50/110]ATO81702.1 ubiquinone/menaquinone biosynthesis methyltransferase ubiE [Actinoplanes sp. SE50]SLL99110.1 ubiquinone/menaquinone biosynthesis methyltransferase ubiE [Actinoplanes sp. SE50/110]